MIGWLQEKEINICGIERSVTGQSAQKTATAPVPTAAAGIQGCSPVRGLRQFKATNTANNENAASGYFGSRCSKLSSSATCCSTAQQRKSHVVHKAGK
jgi:hypothetical protein